MKMIKTADLTHLVMNRRLEAQVSQFAVWPISNRPGWPTRCELGNSRYSRLGSLRYGLGIQSANFIIGRLRILNETAPLTYGVE